MTLALVLRDRSGAVFTPSGTVAWETIGSAVAKFTPAATDLTVERSPIRARWKVTASDGIAYFPKDAPLERRVFREVRDPVGRGHLPARADRRALDGQVGRRRRKFRDRAPDGLPGDRAGGREDGAAPIAQHERQRHPRGIEGGRRAADGDALLQLVLNRRRPALDNGVSHASDPLCRVPVRGGGLVRKHLRGRGIPV